MEPLRESTLKNILYSNLSENMKVRLVDHISQLPESYLEDMYLKEGFLMDVLTTTALIAMAKSLMPALQSCRGACKRKYRGRKRSFVQGCIYQCQIDQSNKALGLASKQASLCSREKNPEQCRAKVAKGVARLKAKNAKLKAKVNTWKVKKTGQGKVIG